MGHMMSSTEKVCVCVGESKGLGRGGEVLGIDVGYYAFMTVKTICDDQPCV